MDNLTKSLDEIYLENKRFSHKRFRNRNRYQRRINSRFQNQPRNNFHKKTFSRDLRKRVSIFNLEKSFTNEQLKSLFQKYGKLTRCGLRLNQMGESKGSGDVQFERHEDALNAIKNINKTNVGNSIVDVRYSNNLRRVNLRRRFRNLRIGNRRNFSFRRRNFRRFRNDRRNLRRGGLGRKRRIFKKSLGRRRRV